MIIQPFPFSNDDSLGGALRQALGQAWAERSNADLRAAALARVSTRLADLSPIRRPPLVTTRRAAFAAVAACAAALVIGILLNRPPKPGIPAPVVVTPPATVPGGAKPAPVRRGNMAGANPSRNLAISPDATILVATGGEDPITLGDAQSYDGRGPHQLHVWDWSKSKDSKPLKASFAGSLAVSPDGKSIVTADGQLIDVDTGKVTPLDNFQGDVRSLRFSLDGKRLVLQIAGKERATHRLLEFPSAKLVCEIPDTWTYTFAAAFTPDNAQIILMGADCFVHRFDAATGKELAKYEPAHTNSIRALVVSDDGKLLASCASSVGEVRVWDLATKKLHREYAIPGNERQLYSLAFSHDAKLLAGGGVDRLLLWDTATANVLHVYPRGSGGAIHLRFSPDDRTLTTVNDFTGLNRNGANLLQYPTVQNYAVEGRP